MEVDFTNMRRIHTEDYNSLVDVLNNMNNTEHTTISEIKEQLFEITERLREGVVGFNSLYSDGDFTSLDIEIKKLKNDIFF
jgi:hypothetical protein